MYDNAFTSFFSRINDNLLDVATAYWNRIKHDSNYLHNLKILDISRDVITGKTPSTKSKELYGDSIPFVKIPDLHNNVYVIDTAQSLSEMGANSQQNKYIPANSILVSCIGTLGLVSINDKKCQTNQQINSVIVNDSILFPIFLELRKISDTISNLGSGGTTIKNLNRHDFVNIELSLPHLDTVAEANVKLKPLFTKIHLNMLESQKLNLIREILLYEYF